MKIYPSLKEAVLGTGDALHDRGSVVDVEHWQGVEAPAPTLELIGASFRTFLRNDVATLVRELSPNLPWADMHFDERVGREPSNPGEAYKHWPFHRKSPDEFHEDVAFSHTYQERLWSANRPGIRHRTGDLQSVVDLLKRDPTTRQAFVPIWWPEDTGAAHEGRVPCTIGYWFVRRNGHLHMTYWIRSCDYFRHFRDDLYLAARLNLWMIEQAGWEGEVKPGFIDFHCGSLHCWHSEKRLLKRINL